MNYKSISNQEVIVVNCIEEDFNIPLGTASASMLENNIWYFNRLFVRSEHRKKGIGTMLLKTLLEEIVKKDVILVLDINPYGDMTYEQLECFYIKHGFIKKNNRLYYIK